MPNFLGIRRDPSFSPDHVENDSEIFRLTAQALRDRHFEVTERSEKDLPSQPLDFDAVFTMARDRRSLSSLLTVERSGKLTINSPTGILNCYRFNMVPILQEAGIPFPRSTMITTDDGQVLREFLHERNDGWIKRGDVHAVVRTRDVSHFRSAEGFLDVIRDFQSRRIEGAVVQEHVVGDTVKFYAIRGGSFFRWYFQDEVANEGLDPDRLFNLAEQAAAALEIEVYGGDAIVTPRGEIIIVDMNDWPTFAPFREEASRAIADHLIQRVSGIHDLSRNQRMDVSGPKDSETVRSKNILRLRKA